MVVFKLIDKHQKLFQLRHPKWHQSFCQKGQNFVYFGPYDFGQIHQHIVQILNKKCMERLKTSDVSISNGTIKYPVGKSIFGVNLTLKLFRVQGRIQEVEHPGGPMSH